MEAEPIDVTTRRHSITERMKGAALLDVATYEEVEHDTTATPQAAAVVGIVAVCAAISGLDGGIMAAVGSLISAYLGWLIWSGVTYVIGDKLLGGTATWGELLRTIGFAQTPGILYILLIVPLFGLVAAFIAWVWLLFTTVVAIRQALDFGTGKAILTAVLGFFAYLLAAGILAGIFGIGGMLG